MAYLLLGLHIDELKDRFSLSELHNIYNIVKPKETLPIRRLKIIDTSDFSILDLDVKYITSNNTEICGLGATDGYLKTSIGLDYLDMDLYGNCYDSKSLSYMPLFLNNKIACKLYNYCLLPIQCRGSSKRVGIRVDTRDLTLKVSVDTVNLFEKKLNNDLKLCIKENKATERNFYYKYVYTDGFILDKYLERVSNNMDVYCGELAVANVKEDTIIPSGATYANIMVTCKNQVKIVLPPSIKWIIIRTGIHFTSKVDLYVSSKCTSQLKKRLKDRRIANLCNVIVY